MPAGSRLAYRVRQFFTALTGKVDRAAMSEARKVLGTDLYRVFASMPEQYRRHALGVYGRIRANGCFDPVVWQAALLHDSGKYDPANGSYVMLGHRVAVVLLEALPGGKPILHRLSRRNDASGLVGRALYPFYLSQHHARLGAKLADEHGASTDVVDLISGHHNKVKDDERLAILQSADDIE